MSVRQLVPRLAAVIVTMTALVWAIGDPSEGAKAGLEVTRAPDVATATRPTNSSRHTYAEPRARPDKNRRFRPDEARRHQANLARKRARWPSAPDRYADGKLRGSWQYRGPDNQPGCWSMAEVVQSDDTVYGITCGHYGGLQWVFKGSLAGDDFRLISARLPHRYVDLFAFDHDGTRRLVLGTETGEIAYTDDDGDTWQWAQGLVDAVQSTIVSHDDGIVYATDGRRVLRSTDGAATFSELEVFSDTVASRLYSPRYDVQPGHDQVYLSRAGAWHRLDGDDFEPRGEASFSGNVNNKFAIAGDERRFYMAADGEFFTSTDLGQTWSKMAGTMSIGHRLGVSAVDPELVVGGYLNPVLSWDAMASTTERNYWGQHQVATAPTPDDRHRVKLHADNQSSQFFLDRAGNELSIRSSDGGLYVSYSEWDQGLPDSGNYGDETYRNITLYDVASTEVYPSGIASGARSPYDIVTGTQDQGTQTTESWSFAPQSFRQAPYGDGPHLVTIDGEWAWSYNYTVDKVYAPFRLYDDAGVFTGAKQKDNDNFVEVESAWYFHAAEPDIAAPGERLWVLSRRLIRVDWNGSTLTPTTTEFAGDAYVGALAQSPNDPDRVALVYAGRLHRSSDRGVTWDDGVATGIGQLEQWDRCGLWISPLDDDHLLLSCPSSNATVSVFSTDGGNTFEDVSGDFPNTRVSSLVGEPEGRFVFASTSFGPYVFDVDALTWTDLASDGVPWFDGRTARYVPDLGAVRFSTWGSGIWDFQIGACKVPVDVDAGDVPNYEAAKSTCPDLCEADAREWTGHWWQVDGGSSCQCCGEDDDGDDDDGDDDDGTGDSGDDDDAGDDDDDDDAGDDDDDDAGDDDDDDDDAGDDDDDDAGDDDDDDTSDDPGQADDTSGCGCSSGNSPTSWMPFVAIIVFVTNRRRAHTAS